ncbi:MULTISPECIES: glycosyltransferase [Flavobacterium]|uniref:glycosyltransferase n=1 Tax=Flavobacterium TaxID=237 RepID=UPI001FCB44E6|nr:MULTISPECIES: glycosyltransferase [Flavobacterium]UOK43799.1 glycosyltransferase [Flavobacterium enshiense]
MRIVQLIDSLETGGAERMAVNYANALADRITFSGLVATRNEGVLKEQLSSKVGYLFLNKKRTVDLSAILKLRKYIAHNKVTHVHAHSSSFFIAVLVRLLSPGIKIVWHDHNGNRLYLPLSGNRKIVWFSCFFNGVIACNTELERWALSYLKCKNILYLPNFSEVPEQEIQTTFLKGTAGKRIVCLANLRTPKNHITLLKAFAASNALQSGWTLHLIGKDNEDDYSLRLKYFVKENKVEDKVFFYGSCPDVFSVLKQSDIGVLVSTYEGFPVTLLEYGLTPLAVLSTNVGYCPEIIEDNENGFLIAPEEVGSIQARLNTLTEIEALRDKFAHNLNTIVSKKFSVNAVVGEAIDFYKKM